jgi:hypothetical protein
MKKKNSERILSRKRKKNSEGSGLNDFVYLFGRGHSVTDFAATRLIHNKNYLLKKQIVCQI